MQSPNSPNDDEETRTTGPQTETDVQRLNSPSEATRNTQSHEAKGGMEREAQEKEGRAKNEKEGEED